MFQRQKQIVPQSLFERTAAQCFLQFERYRLKTHLIGINVEKQILQQCFESLETRMTERYTKLFETLQNQIAQLQKNFMVAKASSLRTLNNIFRNYRRRVGTLSNQPLSNFKYNKFDKNEKLLLSSLIYNERDSYSDILQFREQLSMAKMLGDKEIEDRYRQSNKIEDNYKKILEVIDKTQCYTFKYYDNFQRSILTSIHSLQSHFDKLNGYLSVWQNFGSTKAYDIKSAKQKELQQKNNTNDSRRYVQEETQQQLQEMINNSPLNSIHREQYRKRLNQLRRYNNEKQRKLDMVGKMLNKRKNKAGILQGKSKDLNILDWHFTADGNRVNFSFQDEFRSYTAEPDGNNHDYKPTTYEIQKPIKKQKLDEIKLVLQKNQPSQSVDNLWCYDKYGREGAFDLIGCLSQQVQSRIQFQCTKQTQLQNIDDRRKRQLLDKQNYFMKEGERREALHIGFLHVHEKTEMEWLLERAFSTEYLPEMYAQEISSSDLQFSDEEEQQVLQQEQNQKVKIKQNPKTSKKPNQKKVEVQIIQKQQIQNHQGKIEKGQSNKEKQLKPILKQPKQTKQTQKQISKINQQAILPYRTKHIPSSIVQKDLCLEQLITNTYFKQYSHKVIRKQSDPQYKKSKFVYFPFIQSIKWDEIVQFFECQKAFLITKTSILYFNQVFSTGQEKIKCIVYSIDQNLQQEQLKSNITKCFQNMALVTVKFTIICQELQEDSHTSFIIGLLLVLLKIGEMHQDYQAKDYIRQGKDIIQDFNCYYYPQQYRSPVSFLVRMPKPNKNQEPQLNLQNQYETSLDQSKSTKANTISSFNQTKVFQNENSINKKYQYEREQIISKQKNQQQKSPVVLNSEKPESQHLSLSQQREKIELKRSNSRQFLITPTDALIIPATNEPEDEQQNEEQNDYDCL